MFWNNVKIALRNLRKNKGFAAINITGLAIGLTVYVFGGLIVDYERTHDLFYKYADRIYTIGAGTENASIPVTDPRTGRVFRQTMRVSLDEDTLKQIAGRTDGQYFRATDGRSLAAIYAQIDELGAETGRSERAQAVVAELQAHDVERAGATLDVVVDMSRAILIDPRTDQVL